MPTLILLRHGESLWNKANRFTGWVDIPLSKKGIEEALAAGKILAKTPIDVIFTSILNRAMMTAMLVMSEHESLKVPVIVHKEKWASHGAPEEGLIPVYCSSALNERMYGDLQGLNKAEMMEKYGKEQVHIWRRSYDVAPPGGESLKMTAARSIPYFEESIVPHLRAGKNVFISAHGNSLRSIMMDLDGLSEQEVVNLELATGVPVLYTYVDGKLTKQK